MHPKQVRATIETGDVPTEACRSEQTLAVSEVGQRQPRRQCRPVRVPTRVFPSGVRFQPPSINRRTRAIDIATIRSRPVNNERMHLGGAILCHGFDSMQLWK